MQACIPFFPHGLPNYHSACDRYVVIIIFLMLHAERPYFFSYVSNTGLFTIITYTDNSTLYCTSEDLFTSQKEATPFCIITGKITITTYTCMQI